MSSGTTYGKIIDSYLSYNIEETRRAGLFAVVAETEGEIFAKVGDSGSLIIDPEQSQVIGLLSAVFTGHVEIKDASYENVVFCIRMDTLLDYAKTEWNVNLSFNENAKREDFTAWVS